MDFTMRDWNGLGADLDGQGWALLPGLLGPNECRQVASSWEDEGRFRSRVAMARHGFGMRVLVFSPGTPDAVLAEAGAERAPTLDPFPVAGVRVARARRR